jgi:hypothetical protein
LQVFTASVFTHEKKDSLQTLGGKNRLNL